MVIAQSIRTVLGVHSEITEFLILLGSRVGHLLLEGTELRPDLVHLLVEQLVPFGVFLLALLHLHGVKPSLIRELGDVPLNLSDVLLVLLILR